MSSVAPFAVFYVGAILVALGLGPKLLFGWLVWLAIFDLVQAPSNWHLVNNDPDAVIVLGE